MDEQTQLNLQFGLVPVIETLEEPSLNAEFVNPDSDLLHSHPRQGGRHVSRSDEATISAMNNLALKPVSKMGKQIPQELDDGGPSASPKRISMPEVHVTRLRKRKGQESPESDIPAKRTSSTETRSNNELTHKASKPVIGQLSRPSDPLHAKKLQSSRRSVPPRDKFDILGEQSHKVRSRNIELPEEQVKKPRGRPRKQDAVTTRTPKTFDNLSSSAAVPSRFPRRSHPDLEEPGSNEVLKDDELPNSKAKGSKAADSQASKSSSPPSNAGGSKPGHDTGFRVTRSTKDDLSGPDGLIVPDEWSKIPERRNKGQRQGIISDEPMPAPTSVPDSVAESQEDEDDSVIHEDKDGEVSENGSNHLENPPALSGPGGEGQLFDQNTAQEANDSDEAHQPSEDEDITSPSEVEDITSPSEDEDIISDSEEEDEPAFELFGGTKYWNEVIEGARTVGVSRRKDNVVSKRPKIKTNIGQDLVALLQEVESMYEKASSYTGSAADVETMEHNLQSRLRDLKEIIDELTESNTPEHDNLRSLLVQDIHAHAIPAMVFMLRAALRCRTEKYSEPNDTKTLKEMVRIQELIIRLCEKARRWKAAPKTKRPIKGSKIRTNMQQLKENCFGRELDSRRNLAKQKSNEQRFAESHRRMQERIMLEKQKNRQRIEDQRRLIYQNLAQQRKGVGSRLQRSTPINDAPQLHRRNTPTQWTKQQNQDLVRELLYAETRNLPGRLAITREDRQANISAAQERYLAILNTPSLQNKLPEHIRDRALYYRDFMIQDQGPKDYIMSIE
ncbi:hypothetical protein G7Y79_00009g027430 [Physcia stellaris]|nr:hypothetical protein G7Y79_00009g027430 [Physcia stellaris]